MFELLVSISIFLIITAMVLVNFRSGQYRDELSGAAQLVQSLIREAQTATFSGSATPTPCVLNQPAAAPPSGYGVYLAPPAGPGQRPTVLEFADCETANPTYAYLPNNALFILIKSATLSSHVTFDSSDVPPASPLSIVFNPLSEQVHINGSTAANAVLTLHHAYTTGMPTVTVNSSTGQVFVQ